MKFFRIVSTVLFCILLFGLTPVVDADGPDDDKPPADLPQPASTPPPVKGNFDPVPIRDAQLVLDPAKANIIQLELAEDDQSLGPVAPPATSGESSDVRRESAPGSLMLAEFNKEAGTLNGIPDSANLANDLSIGHLREQGPNNQAIGPAATTIIDFQDFETNFLPTGPPGWDRFFFSPSPPAGFDDVPCLPVESTGSGSAWAADLVGLNPCSATPDNYPSNMNTWLVYGPFSLADAESAYLDFFFRLESESNDDFLFWGASLNGSNFWGQSVSGTHAGGPFRNGYNFASLNLANVPTLGDLTGQSQVWIAFVFMSDSDAITDSGPFIDAILLRKNSDRAVYLTNEGFETSSGNSFPNALWQPTDFGGSGHLWDDVHSFDGPNCPPHAGTGSMWPADIGPNGLDPCKDPPDNYANDMFTWLIHGPFSLEDASEAWIDFYVWSELEQGFDEFFWGVSTDNNTFYGYSTSSSWTQGPFNGYNLRRYDLSFVPIINQDFRGEPEVWLAFVLATDSSVTRRGPFVDDVMITVEKPPPGTSTFLPVISKPPPPPVTTLKVRNNTSANITFTVKNAKLNQAPIGNLACGTITPGQNKSCGSIDTGEYEATAVTNACGTLTKQILIEQTPTHQITVNCVS